MLDYGKLANFVRVPPLGLDQLGGLSVEEQSLIAVLRAHDGLNTEKLLPGMLETARQALNEFITDRAKEEKRVSEK